MKNQTSHPLPLALLALSFSAASLWAQEAPPADPDRNEDVVTLQEFTVTSSAISEYVASESITGTRIASKIQELPFAVNVVTSEFIDDFNALEFGDKFAYTSNVVAYETISTGYSVRGFEADVQLRNGFRRIGLIDKVSVDRAEVIKGPAASIYGMTLPGGIVNIVTKKPKAKPEYRIGFTAGTNNLIRGQASATGPVGDSSKFFYRVDLAGEYREYDMPFKSKEQMTGSVQLLWKLAQNTSLHFELERLVRNEEGNANVPFAISTGNPDPYRINPTTNVRPVINRYERIATELIDFNVQGPLNHSKRWVNTATTTLEHRLSPNMSFRSSANWYDRKLERQEIAGRDQYNPNTGRISGANNATFTNTNTGWVPRFRPYGEAGAGWQNDLLIGFDTGPVKHKLLVTLDYQRQQERPQQLLASISEMPSTDIVQRGLNVNNPDYNYVTYAQNPAAYSNVTQDDKNSIDVYGLFISERATMLDGRLTFLAGGRFDYVDNHAISYSVSSPDNSERQEHDITYQFGVSYNLLPTLTLYSNTSTSFVPNFGRGRDIMGNIFDVPMETGKGWEAGIKASLFAGKLNLTTAYFDIERDGILRNVTNPDNGQIYQSVSGKEGAQGVEFDFNWVLSNEWQVFGAYGWTDSKIIDHREARHLIGTTTRRTPEHTIGLGTKYDVKTGALKGLFFTAGYKYNSESLVNPSNGRVMTITAQSNGNPSTTAIINSRLPNGLLIFPDRPEGDLVHAVGFRTNPVTGLPTTTPSSITVRVDDGRESIYNASYHVVDFGFGYKWRVNRRYNHRVQFNATNIFDEVYTFGSAGQGQRMGFSLTYDLRF
jgi:outer membrane receptor protein involved in Fe transport